MMLSLIPSYLLTTQATPQRTREKHVFLLDPLLQACRAAKAALLAELKRLNQ